MHSLQGTTSYLLVFVITKSWVKRQIIVFVHFTKYYHPEFFRVYWILFERNLISTFLALIGYSLKEILYSQFNAYWIL